MMNFTDPPGGFLQPEPDCDKLFRLFFWLVFVGSLLVYGWGIWSVPLLTHNEARRLVVLRELLASGDWLIPTKNGQVYLQKPPLFTWFGAVFALLSASTAEWVLRLPSALSGFGATWLLFYRLKRYIGQWPALFGAAVLVTSYFFSTKARLAEINMLLTVCVFAAIVCLYEYICGGARRYLSLVYGALGLAFLTKGPVALLFFIPPVLIFGLLEKDRRTLKALVYWPGWLVFGLIAFPWYLYVNLYLEGTPMLSVIRSEVSAKVVEVAHQAEPAYYYIRHLLGSFAPWVLLIFYRPMHVFRRIVASKSGRFFGLAALVPLLLFSLFDYKRDKYILPIYPAMAVCLGMVAEHWRMAMAQRGRAWVGRVMVGGTAVLMLVLIGYFGYVEPRAVAYRFESLKPLASRIDSLRGDVPVYYLGEEPIQLIYYYGRPLPEITADKVALWQEQQRPFLVLVRKKHIKKADGLRLEIIDQMQPYLSKRGVMYIMGSAEFMRTMAAGDGHHLL
ncbi:ArnT family glycosyltransferase [Syntrophotalea carbinolica]|nr:glycosyltransferase family 39 protein [Syntrophotalea carbinolica]